MGEVGAKNLAPLNVSCQHHSMSKEPRRPTQYFENHWNEELNFIFEELNFTSIQCELLRQVVIGCNSICKSFLPPYPVKGSYAFIRNEVMCCTLSKGGVHIPTTARNVQSEVWFPSSSVPTICPCRFKWLPTPFLFVLI